MQMSQFGQAFFPIFDRLDDDQLLDLANQLRYIANQKLADMCIEELTRRAGQVAV